MLTKRRSSFEIAMNAKMLAVLEIEDHARHGGARCSHEPVRADDDVLEREPIRLGQLPQEAGEIKRWVLADVIGAQQPDSPIDLLQGMDHVLLESARQVGGILPKGLIDLVLERQRA